MVLEGVHLLPDLPSPALLARATAVRALIAVRDPEAHRRHFHARGAQTLRAPERYLEALDRIRTLQDYLIVRAEAAGIPVIDARQPGADAAPRAGGRARCGRDRAAGPRRTRR